MALSLQGFADLDYRSDIDVGLRLARACRAGGILAPHPLEVGHANVQILVQLYQHLRFEGLAVSRAGRERLLEHEASGDPIVPVVAFVGRIDPQG